MVGGARDVSEVVSLSKTNSFEWFENIKSVVFLIKKEEVSIWSVLKRIPAIYAGQSTVSLSVLWLWVWTVKTTITAKRAIASICSDLCWVRNFLSIFIIITVI